MKKIKYSFSVSSYLKNGIIYSTTLDADTVEGLQKKKEDFIEEEKDSAEVITFGDIVITTTKVLKDSNVVLYFVDKTTNSYLMHLSRNVKVETIKNEKENKLKE